MISLILAFVLALALSNITEWVAHNYILHGLGKEKDSFFHYHWKHHNACRKHQNFDVMYTDFFKSFSNKDVWKELLSVFVLLAINCYWLWIWPAVYFFIVFFGVLYFVTHAYSHTNVEWGKKWMMHHYDHHMGKNQDLNWCVVFPFFDWIMKTRVSYEYDENGKAVKAL